MDPNIVVLEISSDEEVGWDDHAGGDDHNWIAELLDEVNRDDDCDYDCGYDDDSDEVVVVSEVLPSKKSRKKFKSKCSSLIVLDDDCVMLDHDPDKPVEVRNDNPIDDGEDDDSDDLLVVSEKGQVACRDYPHPRHLCIKFAFSSTPTQNHCNQCYCYVCDSLAPCVYWGNGSATLDHCRATDKDEFWILERKNSKNCSVPKVVDALMLTRPPPMNLGPPATPSMAQNHVSRPAPTRAASLSSNFGVPNIVNRGPFSLSQGFLSKISRDREHDNCNLSNPFQKPVFKRSGSNGVAGRYSHSSYRDNYKNPCRQPNYRVSGILSGSSQSNTIDTSSLFSPPTMNSVLDEPLPFQPEFSNTQFDFSSNVHSPVENPLLFQPLLAKAPSVPNYSVPAGAPVDSPSVPVPGYTPNLSHQVSPTIDPGFVDKDISWTQIETGPQTQSSLLEAGDPTNGPAHATISAGLVDYQYDNWIFNNQPCEPGSIDVPGPFGLNEFSPEPTFIDTGTIFDF